MLREESAVLNGVQKSLLLVTATPTTSAASPGFCRAQWEWLSRPVCSHGHFETYSWGSLGNDGAHARAAGTCPPPSALCFLTPPKARRPSKILWKDTLS